jgi:hypothetical protein
MVTLLKWMFELLLTGGMKAFRSGGGRGIGSLLMVEYHKSSTADTPPPTRVGSRCIAKAVHTGYQLPLRRRVSCGVGTPTLAGWMTWAADDLWYSTMRKPPMASVPQRQRKCPCSASKNATRTTHIVSKT